MKKKTRGVSGMKQDFFLLNEVDLKPDLKTVQKRERGREFQPVGPKKEEEHPLNCSCVSQRGGQHKQKPVGHPRECHRPINNDSRNSVKVL